MATASARHILVDTEEQCQDLKNRIDEGADFAELAGGATIFCASGIEFGYVVLPTSTANI